MRRNSGLLVPATFKTIIENTPLVSIDLCLVCNGQVLLGKRKKQPLKGSWFTPGGRIYKNESWQVALKRIALSELGLSITELDDFELMGVWDHFYPNSAIDEGISTHYVDLPHFCRFESKPVVLGDDQHDSLDWFDIDKVASDVGFHQYVRNYAGYLMNKGVGDIKN
jgi:colanic acid biosynthesis protein WcaH